MLRAELWEEPLREASSSTEPQFPCPCSVWLPGLGMNFHRSSWSASLAFLSSRDVSWPKDCRRLCSSRKYAHATMTSMVTLYMPNRTVLKSSKLKRPFIPKIKNREPTWQATRAASASEWTRHITAMTENHSASPTSTGGDTSQSSTSKRIRRMNHTGSSRPSDQMDHGLLPAPIRIAPSTGRLAANTAKWLTPKLLQAWAVSYSSLNPSL
mmetsp:Transcript_29181/g.76433  ORF Transcript_29181/g.76433 Transcript_29181/m.76433 type:complete len:211 (+) Transcript_29181:112-744(+)